LFDFGAAARSVWATQAFRRKPRILPLSPQRAKFSLVGQRFTVFGTLSYRLPSALGAQCAGQDLA
jgi:hypothetical protein